MSHRQSHHVVTRIGRPLSRFKVSPRYPPRTNPKGARHDHHPNLLTRWAGIAAAAAGAIFIAVQINHPQLNATSIQTTDVYIRDSLKVLMAALALAGSPACT